ncbi:MAG: hypothetical protein ACLGPL_05675 [Acidobacteriota bacterium]
MQEDLNLFGNFGQQYETLRSLFPAEHFTRERKERLDELFRFSEAKWEENLRRLNNVEVKYLLIAEALLWPKSHSVSYFYDSCDGPWVNRIWKASFDFPKPADPKHALDLFASKGFLLVDSLPFAENYSGRRSHEKYRQLVRSCSPFLLEKLSRDTIVWADNVKVALAFKLNGQAIIKSHPAGIRLPTGQVIRLTDELICADGSGYTNSAKLRSVFGISAPDAS